MRIGQLENVERIPFENHFIFEVFIRIVNVTQYSYCFNILHLSNINKIIIITINKTVLMIIYNNTF